MATFAIGDSITQGHCDSTHSGYVGRINDRLARIGDDTGSRVFDVTNLARSGKGTDVLMPILDGALAGLRQNYMGRVLVLAMIGGPESMYSIDKETKVESPITDMNDFGKTVVDLANMCKRRRAYLAFIGNSFIARTEPYERRSELYAINDSRYAAYQAPVRAVAKAIGAPYIELHDSMVEAAKTQQIICDDGVHPSALGHELMDKLVWDSGVIQDFYSATRPPKNTALPEDFALPQVGLVA